MSATVPTGLIRTKEGHYVLEVDSHLSAWVHETGRLDLAAGEIERVVKKYIPIDGVVVDAGASLGDHAITYAQIVGPKGLVFAFEPNPLAFRALSLNMSAHSNVICTNAALSDKPGEAKLNLNLCAGMAYVGDEQVSDSGEVVTVKCVKLDDILKGIHRLDFVHYDVEGSERRAILGMERLIAQFHPVIWFEVNQMCLERGRETEKALRETIAALGYSWVECDEKTAANTQRDVLAIP